MCLMPENELITQEQLSVISKVAVASIGSQGTLGLLVGGVVSITDHFFQILTPQFNISPLNSSSKPSAGG